MVRSQRWWQLVALAALPALGCGMAHRPYANDPILRERDPVWGNVGRARGIGLGPHAEPAAPQAPTHPPPLADGWVVTDPITSR